MHLPLPITPYSLHYHLNHLPHTPPPAICGKIVFHKTGPWCQKCWGPLPCSTLLLPLPRGAHHHWSLCYCSAPIGINSAVRGQSLLLTLSSPCLAWCLAQRRDPTINTCRKKLLCLCLACIPSLLRVSTILSINRVGEVALSCY